MRYTHLIISVRSHASVVLSNTKKHKFKNEKAVPPSQSPQLELLFLRPPRCCAFSGQSIHLENGKARRREMERSTPVRKTHSSTADLLTWSETPPPADPRPDSAARRSHMVSPSHSRDFPYRNAVRLLGFGCFLRFDCWKRNSFSPRVGSALRCSGGRWLKRRSRVSTKGKIDLSLVFDSVCCSFRFWRVDRSLFHSELLFLSVFSLFADSRVSIDVSCSLVWFDAPTWILISFSF